MRRDTANADFQMKCSYRETSSTPGPETQIHFRKPDGANFDVVRMWPTSCNISEVRSGATFVLAAASWTTTANQWYDVTIIADGPHLELWRGPKGGAQSRLCSVDSATILSGTRSTIMTTVGGTYSFDDFQMTAEDLSNTTYAYDTASQLSSMTANGTTTNYTYDDWGRMVGKTQGGYTATYGYRFGDKLKWVHSNFPGENAVVDYNYDGLGKRRQEQLDNSSLTWFRWSGWEESGEYAGTVGSWTVGAKQTGYVPGLAAYAGANPTTADWRFFLNDHLGSPRQMLGQDKSAKARFDFSPYGELMRSAGLPLTVGYTGHRWDPAIGQYFAPFRYYNPQTARWNMRDPLGYGAGVNMYAYVAGRPTGATDRLGLSDTKKSEDPKLERYCNSSQATGEPEGQTPRRPRPPQPAPELPEPVPQHGGDWDPGNFDLDPSLENPLLNLFENPDGSPGDGWSKSAGQENNTKANWKNGKGTSLSRPSAHKGHEYHIDVHLPDGRQKRVYPDGTCELKKSSK